MGWVRYFRRRLLWKLVAAMVAISLPVLALFPLYVLPAVEEKLHGYRAASLQHATETAMGVVGAFLEEEQAGRMTRAQAQAAAAAALERLRYGGGQEFFFVTDLDNRMVMHPHLKELVGRDMSGHRDARGKATFLEVSALARRDRRGFLRYMTYRPGGTVEVPKESYFELVAPWGWVVGTGVYVDDLEADVARFRRNILLAAGAVLLGAVGMAVVLAARVLGPVRALSDAATRVAGGDLGVSVPVGVDDEVGQLARAFNGMVRDTRELMRAIVGASHSTAGALERLRGSAEGLAAVARQQSQELQHIAVSVEEMSVTVSRSADSSRITASAAQENERLAERHGAVVGEAGARIREAAAAVEDSAVRVERLHASGEHIARMSALIRGIAEQTNMLALNAAIEAQRAGGHGKGFAVIAGEVRKLAMRSREAADQIAQVLSTHQQETAGAAEQMTAGATRVREGLALSAETGEALGHILQGTHEILRQVTDVAQVTAQQATTSRSIAGGVQTLHTGAQGVAQGAGEVAGAVEQIRELTGQLRALVARFRLEG
jgi:methyl-accepting chemotaxis protein